MFAQAAEVLKKRDAKEAKVSDKEEPKDDDASKGIMKTNKLMTKLMLQHEDSIRGTFRDRNVVVKLKA